MATKILPYPPVRPMDPEYISKFLSNRDLSKKMISGFVKALGNYNKACNKAVIDLEKELNKLLKPLV